MKTYACLSDKRCRNHGVRTTKTLQQSCHWARILGGAFCRWCAGDLTHIPEST